MALYFSSASFQKLINLIVRTALIIQECTTNEHGHQTLVDRSFFVKIFDVAGIAADLSWDSSITSTKTFIGVYQLRSKNRNYIYLACEASVNGWDDLNEVDQDILYANGFHVDLINLINEEEYPHHFL